MNPWSRLKKQILCICGLTIGVLILSTAIMIHPNSASALSSSSGEDLFKQHCSGCHINGGNIIRRSKNLKLKALKRQGLDDPQAIARVAREGIGTMSGYEKVLGEGGDKLVAQWIWTQVQKAWVQG